MLKATVRNFLINAGVAGMKKQAESRWCASRTSYACVMHALTASLLPLTIVPSLMRRLLMICSWSKTSFRPSAWRARGKGTFAQVERAVEILRGRRLPFGISCCYTSRNVEVIGSEEYFDQMIAWGAKFCWFFTYMPIGREAAPELMVSAEQRAFMYRRHINDVSPEDVIISISMPMETMSPVPLFTTPMPMSAPTRFWRPSRHRSSRPAGGGSPGMRTTCAPVRCWAALMRWWRRWSAPVPAPRISSRRKTSGPWPASAGTPRKLGRRWPMSFGQVPTETLECGR